MIAVGYDGGGVVVSFFIRALASDLFILRPLFFGTCPGTEDTGTNPFGVGTVDVNVVVVDVEPTLVVAKDSVLENLRFRGLLSLTGRSQSRGSSI